MSFDRAERGTVTKIDAPGIVSSGAIRERRRRRALPRALTARDGACTARTKQILKPRPVRTYEPRVIGEHDFGDGRHAIEFEGPSLDLMLYHDRGTTLAEWVTVDGELVIMAAVGDC
jgi:hypothetical protein